MNSQPPQRRAVIDVGTNSIKLLVADVAGPLITPVSEESNQTRLGAGFYASRQLKPAAIAATAAAAANYAAKAARLGASSVRVIGTSAARDALNAAELAAAIRQQSGLPIQVLSGEEEAQWVFRGVASDPKLARLPALILDVGGGSTEFIVGEDSVPRFCRSYPLGTVRLLEELQPADPPGLDALGRCRARLRQFLEQHVVPDLQSALGRCRGEPRLVGAGGTAAILARMEAGAEGFNREQIEATLLPVARLRARLEEQWQLPLAGRRKTPGLPPDRADVILTGMAIYEAIMDRFGFERLRITTRGLRYWALLQPPETQPDKSLASANISLHP
jgi:exopolyphosphatase/guanosine-5'-triphosphate,3'-diphosphate pyrophosphatase